MTSLITMFVVFGVWGFDSVSNWKCNYRHMFVSSLFYYLRCPIRHNSCGNCTYAVCCVMCVVCCVYSHPSVLYLSRLIPNTWRLWIKYMDVWLCTWKYNKQLPTSSTWTYLQRLEAYLAITAEYLPDFSKSCADIGTDCIYVFLWHPYILLFVSAHRSQRSKVTRHGSKIKGHMPRVKGCKIQVTGHQSRIICDVIN